ncbi:MAG: hypothetical protein LAT77_08625 [Aliidiomarina sp.]|uniref:hypothetical protein n=1 Tax=Aliidiomarina sp. TaxID=1872439 RepID=UPI0025BA17DA|nr:hypothetical protein [Aliidiomarina sp.]MCH8501957.1 hypothetical protein [Aliidiomarina sp.]
MVIQKWIGRGCAVAVTVIGLSACSEINSEADIEVLQQEQLRADLQRLENTTTRSSLRAALDDPRLHPYALARAMFEQSDLKAQAPTFLFQFAATLIDADVAPDLVERELDQLLTEFDEISRQQAFYAQSPWVFYIRMLRFSERTANHERTERLRLQVENYAELHAFELDARGQMIEFYSERGELEHAHRHYEQIDDRFGRVTFGLDLIKAYAQQGNDRAVQRLVDELSRDPESVGYLIDDWIETLLLANRREQALSFLLERRDIILASLTSDSPHMFFIHAHNFTLIIQHLLDFGRATEAREALIQGYRYGLENSPGDWYLLRGALPYLQGFEALGDVALLEEAKRDLFSRIYALLDDEENFATIVFGFSNVMQELELESLGLEFIDVVAGINESEQRVAPELLYFLLSYAYGLLGEEQKGQAYLQQLFDDFVLLEQLMTSSAIGQNVVISYLLEAGYIDEVKSLIGPHPSFTNRRQLFDALITHERYLEALQVTAEQDIDPVFSIIMLLQVAHGYLKRGQLPNAEARELMARHWSRYMPME